MKAQTTQKGRVRKLLGSRKWIPASQINKVAGSPHGTRRARELRAEGWEIKTRRTGRETEYRVTAKA